MEEEGKGRALPSSLLKHTTGTVGDLLGGAIADVVTRFLGGGIKDFVANVVVLADAAAMGSAGIAGFMAASKVTDFVHVEKKECGVIEPMYVIDRLG